MKLVLSGRNARGVLSVLTFSTTAVLEAGEKKEIRAAMSKALAECGTLSVAAASQDVVMEYGETIEGLSHKTYPSLAPIVPAALEPMDHGPAIEAIERTVQEGDQSGDPTPPRPARPRPKRTAKKKATKKK